jgi:hypothetical protein
MASALPHKTYRVRGAQPNQHRAKGSVLVRVPASAPENELLRQAPSGASVPGEWGPP